ncbi:MAG: creatininase family protein [Pirellulales bacterium]
MLWEELAWPAFRRLNKDMPVVVPLGACEQHGPHLPVFVDTIQVTQIARRVEAQLVDEILLAPTLWLGSSHHHKDFPGTISVLPSLFGRMVQEVALSVVREGFRRVFFLNGHGGNIAPATSALTELIAQDDQVNDTYLALASWWRVAADGIRPEHVGLSQPVVSHACAYETSLMLALRPDLVNLSQLPPRPAAVLRGTWFHSEDDSSQRVTVFRRFHRFTTDGAMGRPQEASADHGGVILDAVTEQIVAFLRDFASWPVLPVLGPEPA